MKRWWHNWRRLRGRYRSIRVYVRTLHEWPGGLRLCWLRRDVDTGDFQWSPKIQEATPIYRENALLVLKRRKDVWLFTESEWKEMLSDAAMETHKIVYPNL